jgi:hypothetical protein
LNPVLIPDTILIDHDSQGAAPDAKFTKLATRTNGARAGGSKIMATASKGHIVAVPEGSVPPKGATDIPKGIKVSASALIKATSKVKILRELTVLLPPPLLPPTMLSNAFLGIAPTFSTRV